MKNGSSCSLDISKCVWAIFKREVSPQLLKDRVVRRLKDGFAKEREMRRKMRLIGKRIACMKKRGTYVDKNKVNTATLRSFSAQEPHLNEVIRQFVKYRSNLRIIVRIHKEIEVASYALVKNVGIINQLRPHRSKGDFNVIGFLRHDGVDYLISAEDAFVTPNFKKSKVFYKFNDMLGSPFTSVIIGNNKGQVVYFNNGRCDLSPDKLVESGLEALGIKPKHVKTIAEDPVIGSNLINQLNQLAEMHKAGALTAKEFTRAKNRLLNK
jgi:hypothetical protein